MATPDDLRDAVTCLWSVMTETLRHVVRENYPGIAAIAEADYVSANNAQDRAIREATDEQGGE